MLLRLMIANDYGAFITGFVWYVTTWMIVLEFLPPRTEDLNKGVSQDIVQ